MSAIRIYNNIRIIDETSCRALLHAMEMAEEVSRTLIRKPLNVIELKTASEIRAFIQK